MVWILRKECDYIASGNIVKQTLVNVETTPTENYAINWLFG